MPVTVGAPSGASAGMVCTQVNEPADPHAWRDNYSCAPRELGLRWSYAGPIAGMNCVPFSEGADPNIWNDNHLCFPR
jgi:hypothetical protein